MDHKLILLATWSLLLLLIGYLVPFIKDLTRVRIITWTLALITSVLSITLTGNQPALLRMLIITSLQLLCMKGIVMGETYTGKPKLNFFQWIFFSLGWFGMRPAIFESLISKPLLSGLTFIVKGFSRILVGILLIYVSRNFSYPYLENLILLVGLSLILHFGILNISTGIWRLFGVDAKELFISPYKSKSLREFWGRRWNMAFSEMTALALYKPLLRNYSKTKAMLLSFLFSGVLHEIAISFPVNSGYGLPMLYFLIHAVLMYVETKIAVVRKITSHRFLSHIWVMAWLILPMPLLFHRDFITFVIKPLAYFILKIFMIHF